MRRIELGAGQIFEEKMLNRTGAFNAEALIAATNIVEDVRSRGDEALREYTKKFDGVELETFRVSQSAIDEALTRVDPKVASAIQQAAAQIRDFHERQKQQGWFTLREDGALVGAKVQPLDSVGIYVPGGRALYPSSVLMNAIPASVAGVRRIVCVTPPTKDGSLDPAILEACRVSGVTEIYSVGGAQAIAALAYGTESIAKVDKITGPGNAFVAAAKKVVSGDVGIDMIAGPSEVCVVADETALPELVAIDLMAQAEHDPLASCYLVTFSAEYADQVEAAIELHMQGSTRAEITTASLTNQGLIIICPDMNTALDVVNVIAPEHLELHVPDAMELLGAMRVLFSVVNGPRKQRVTMWLALTTRFQRVALLVFQALFRLMNSLRNRVFYSIHLLLWYAIRRQSLRLQITKDCGLMRKACVCAVNWLSRLLSRLRHNGVLILRRFQPAVL